MNFFTGRIHVFLSLFLILVLLHPLLILLPLSFVPAEAASITEELPNSSSEQFLYIGQSLSRTENSTDETCTLIHGSNGASGSNSKMSAGDILSVGKEDDNRCYKSALYWGIDSWDAAGYLSDMTEISLNFEPDLPNHCAPGNTHTYCPIDNNGVEIRAKISNTRDDCENTDPSSEFFNNFETWTLLADNWIPFPSHNNSALNPDSVSKNIPGLITLLQNRGANTHLCLVLSQTGQDMVGPVTENPEPATSITLEQNKRFILKGTSSNGNSAEQCNTYVQTAAEGNYEPTGMTEAQDDKTIFFGQMHGAACAKSTIAFDLNSVLDKLDDNNIDSIELSFISLNTGTGGAGDNYGCGDLRLPLRSGSNQYKCHDPDSLGAELKYHLSENANCAASNQELFESQEGWTDVTSWNYESPDATRESSVDISQIKDDIDSSSNRYLCVSFTDEVNTSGDNAPQENYRLHALGDIQIKFNFVLQDPDQPAPQVHEAWQFENTELHITRGGASLADTSLSKPILSDTPHGDSVAAMEQGYNLGRFPGDQITITGNLTSDGVGLSGQTVKIYAYNGTDNSSTLVNTTTTNSNGEYTAYWTVTWIHNGKQFTHLYAKFDETTGYKESKSDETSIGAISGGSNTCCSGDHSLVTSLSLNASKTDVTVGEVIIFTGKINVANPHVTPDFTDDSFWISIRDSSTGNTLASTNGGSNLEANGDFTITWTVIKVVPSNNVPITGAYAFFSAGNFGGSWVASESQVINLNITDSGGGGGPPDDDPDDEVDPVFTSESGTARVYFGKTLRHDDPSNPNADTTCNLIALDDFTGVQDQNAIVFGQKEDSRCHKSVMQWDISSWDLTDMIDVVFNYTEDSSDALVLNDPLNNLAEIHATVSSSPCLADSSVTTSYFNSIDSSWTLLKTDWHPTSNYYGEAGSVHLPLLTSLLSSDKQYLCLSFSQAGIDVGNHTQSGTDDRLWHLGPLNVGTAFNITIIRDTSSSTTPVTTTLTMSASGFCPTNNCTANLTQVAVGQQITFEGQLFDSSTGNGLVNETIGLYELCPCDPAGNSSLMSTTTGSLGKFNFTWTAESQYLNHCKSGTSNPCILELFAQFDGYTNSSNFVFTTNYSPLIDIHLTTLSTDCSTIHCGTNITLGANWGAGFLLTNTHSSGTVSAGVNVTFIGQLTHNGSGIPNQLITISDWDSDNNNDTLVTTTTLPDGRFSIDWIAECKDDGETPCRLELFAEFVGNATSPNSGYGSSSTSSNTTAPFHFLTISTTMDAHFQSMTISDATPGLGDLVTISARLRRSHDNAPLSNVNIEFIAVQSDSQSFSISNSSTNAIGEGTATWIATSNISLIRVEFAGTGLYTSDSISIAIVVQNSITVDTHLILDSPPSEVENNSSLTFTGRLTRTDTDAGISNQKIEILENDGEFTEVLSSGYTDDNGYFEIQWTVQFMDSDLDIEVYSRFNGNNTMDADTAVTLSSIDSTPIHTISIVDIDTPPSSSVSTTLTLDSPIDSIVDGDTMTFTGRLIRSNDSAGIPSKQISLFDVNSQIVSGSTDNNGYFIISWAVDDLTNDNLILLNARYLGDSSYGSSESLTYVITILPYVPQTPLTPASPIAWQSFISTHQSNIGEECNDFASAIPEPALSFGQTDNWRCYIAVAMWDLSSITAGLQLDDINDIKLTYRGSALSHCQNGTANCDDPDPAEISYIISPYKCYNGFENHNTNYWRSTENWDNLVSDWIPLNNIHNIDENSISIDSLKNQLNNGNYLCLAFSQSGTNEAENGIKHSYWRITDITFDIITTPTNLFLSSPIQEALIGDSITFSGSLSNANNGEGIPDMLITIFESDVNDASCNINCERSVLATGTTEDDGSFSIIWYSSFCEDTFEIMDTCMLEVYAEFSSTVAYSSSSSEIRYIVIISNFDTSLTLDPIPSSAIVGSTIHFTGRLIESNNGVGVPGVVVRVYDHDGGFNDDLLQSGFTDANGYFTISWVVSDEDILDNDLEIYVLFVSSGNYLGSQSSIQILDIITPKISTSIVWNTMPNAAFPGDDVVIHGTLTNSQTNEGLPNLFICIIEYDGDAFIDCDDALFSDYTDSNGGFWFSWDANCLDVEDPCVNELIAYFEGTIEFEQSWTIDIHEIQILELEEFTITLDCPPNQNGCFQIAIEEDSVFTFTGKLVNNATGIGIPNHIVYIYYSSGVGCEWFPCVVKTNDILIGQGPTDSNGFFSINWLSENYRLSEDCHVDCRASFFAHATLDSRSFNSYSRTATIYTQNILNTDLQPSISLSHSPNNPTSEDEIELSISIETPIHSNLQISLFIFELRVYFNDNLIETLPTDPDLVSNDFVIQLNPLPVGEHSYRIELTCLAATSHPSLMPPIPCGKNNENLLINSPIDGNQIILVQDTVEMEDVNLTFYVPAFADEQNCGLNFVCINEGSSVTFSGFLTDSNNQPIENMAIQIFDVFSNTEILITSAITNSSGQFEISWDSYCTTNRNPCYLSIKASFSGTANYHPSVFPDMSQGGNYPFDYMIEIIYDSFDFNGQVICDGIYCVDSWPGESSINPIPMAEVHLFTNDVLALSTRTSLDGSFIFNNISSVDSNGNPISFSITVILDDGEFVRILDVNNNENRFEKSVFLGQFINSDSVPNIPIIFDSVPEMNAASVYVYAHEYLEFIAINLDQTEIISYPAIDIILPYASTPGGNAQAWYSFYLNTNIYTADNCFGFGSSKCYIGIYDFALPSGSSGADWKDSIGHELIHALQWAAGGNQNENGIILYDTLANYWLSESLAVFFSDAIQYEMGENTGTAPFQSFVHGWAGSAGCAILDVAPLTFKNYILAYYNGYVHPTTDDISGIYCNLTYILWDFYDHDGVFDWFNEHVGPDGMIQGGVTLWSGLNYADSENTSIPLQVLWDTLLENPNIYSLSDIHDLLASYDPAGVEEVFNLHNAPGGVPQM